jgi:polyhydroxyalkanoate synthase subunit PhaC
MAPLEELSYGMNLTGQDPAELTKSLFQLAAEIAQDPAELARSGAELAVAQAGLALEVSRLLLGSSEEPAIKPDPSDRRFKDPAWQESPWHRGVLGSYLLWARWWGNQMQASRLEGPARRKAAFALNLLLDAAAPTNLPWLNPSVWKQTVETGGMSLARGGINALTDILLNNGRPRQVDVTPFELGRNLAATPGRVVLRNELIELLMYEPQTEHVHRNPLVCSPPWINKYYVMDLAPDRSFIEYAVRAGHTVFAISYRNPDASMRDLGMEDYLRLGWLTAVEAAQSITEAPKVNVLGLCLGGTLTGIGLAYLAARGEQERIGWAAFTNTLLDFSEPGDLGVFADEAGVRSLEARMQKKGYLEASTMAGTFDWMRGNDLVWSYVISNWYMGKQPPAFDILAWNSDSTNMPATMHSEYLRSCYLENRLARPGAFRIADTNLDLSTIDVPVYVLGAQNDHIAPWRGTYRTTQLVGGEARYVLTSAGHIAGIVNPPDNPKTFHYVRDDCPADPEAWLEGARRVSRSWWEDWAEWAAERSGDQVAPPAVPPGDPAPGRYVRNQVGGLRTLSGLTPQAAESNGNGSGKPGRSRRTRNVSSGDGR